MTTSGNTFKTRLARFAVKSLIRGLRCIPLRDVDVAEIVMNQTESILNLPDKLPFFPTPTTDPEVVRRFLTELHPIDYGKALIRLGPEGDGGYLVPDDLDGITACFSPGVSTVAGFEVDCAERGMQIFMADASVSAPPVNHPRFQFIPKFIGAKTEEHFISLEDWVQSTVDGNSDLMLQMDIEGFEYEALASVPTAILERFRIIVIEFHEIDFLFSRPIFSLYQQIFRKLLKSHACVHVHPNNYCPVIKIKGVECLQMGEFTFVRRDRITRERFATNFPHPLDRDNTNKRPVTLPSSFYRAA